MAKRPCSTCGEVRVVNRASLLDVICHKCRAKRRRELPATQLVLGLSQASVHRTTQQKGLGYAHQLAVEELKRQHVDASTCEWCGRPMYLDPTRNWDYDRSRPLRRGNGKLHGDHRNARNKALRSGLHPAMPDRLLHGVCNVQRGDGGNDHLAWINHGTDCSTTQFDTAGEL